MAPPRKPIHERLASNSRKVGDCLIWSGSKTRDGYGVLTVGRKQYRAHRIAYEVANSVTLWPGIMVCHRCDTPACIEPAHLFLGSAADNTRDMLEKGRATRLTGENHPGIKIPHAEREIIRGRKADGETLAGIAKDYGVAFQTISDICNGRRSYGAA